MDRIKARAYPLTAIIMITTACLIHPVLDSGNKKRFR